MTVPVAVHTDTPDPTMSVGTDCPSGSADLDLQLALVGLCLGLGRPVAAGKAVELLSETCHLMAVLPAACWVWLSWLASAVAGAAIIAAAIPAAAIFDAGRLRRRVKLGRSQPPMDSAVGARPPVPPQRAKATVSNPRRKAWGSQNQASTPPPPGGAVPARIRVHNCNRPADGRADGGLLPA